MAEKNEDACLERVRHLLKMYSHFKQGQSRQIKIQKDLHGTEIPNV